jgi:hypothetical protein
VACTVDQHFNLSVQVLLRFRFLDCLLCDVCSLARSII